MDLPTCVRFAPTDEEVFDEFLSPRMQPDFQALLQNSLIHDFDLYDNAPMSLHLPDQPLFLQNHYWMFVNRQPLSPNSTKPNRDIAEPLVNGMWKEFGKPKTVCRGNTVNLEKMTTLEYVTPEKLKTGWRQHEYQRIFDVPAFQTIVVVHLFYDGRLDQTAVPQLGDVNDLFDFADLFNDGQNAGNNA